MINFVKNTQIMLFKYEQKHNKFILIVLYIAIIGCEAAKTNKHLPFSYPLSKKKNRDCSRFLIFYSVTVPSPETSSPGVSSPGVSSPGTSSPGTSSPGVSSPGVSAGGVVSSPPK